MARRELPKNAGPNELVAYFARHLVSVTYFDRSPERVKECDGSGLYTQLSGFIISVRGIWHIITAGHIIADVDQAIERGQKLNQWMLDDTFGLEAEHNDPVPFDYLRTNRFHFYQDGYDYGLIELSPYYRDHLIANHIEPMDEKIWDKKWPENFDGFLMLGFPSQLVRARRFDKNRVYIERSVALIKVERIDQPPADMVVAANRFYGRIASRADCLAQIPGGPDATFTDIDGMSGGPIIAFRQEQTGFRYWLYAVQSAWNKETRIIAACPIENFMHALGEHVDEISGEAT
jgi:hypothetical protein